MNKAILEINDLSIHFKTLKAVDKISFVINQGEILGIAGESGSGKSQTALSILGLLSHQAIIRGSIRFMEQEIMGLPLPEMNRIRGNQISMIFQDPMTSLNPYLTIASQMTEVLMWHKGSSYQEALKTSLNLLELTRIADAKNRIHLYPHEFSGGMQQRVMIAMSLLCQPTLLIADEPTTALDVTMQAQILQILKDLQHEFHISILIITHDMGVMANICDHIQIMYKGQFVENGTSEQIFYTPQHPYTQKLLKAIPSVRNTILNRTEANSRSIEIPTHADGQVQDRSLLTVRNLKVHFKKIIYAVDDVSFDVYTGEILGIVGESGCGKSSLARALVGLNSITSGDVIFQKAFNLGNLTEKQWHLIRKEIQFIFQDPIASLNPRMTVLELIAEPLKIYHPHLTSAEITEHVLIMMEQVGLSRDQMYRYAQEFSGGQCQRIAIARALIIKPKLLICDEAVSALDGPIKLQIIHLLKDLQKQYNLTIIFISHDMGVIKHLCDRVLVMYLGQVMELSTNVHLYEHPHHPYTQALLSAVPVPDPRIEHQKTLKLLDGDLPSSTPLGCPFHTRCPLADVQCRLARPPMIVLPDGAKAACIKI